MKKRNGGKCTFYYQKPLKTQNPVYIGLLYKKSEFFSSLSFIDTKQIS